MSDAPCVNNQPSPAPVVLTEGEKAVIGRAVRKYLPIVVKWALSDHDSPVARLLCKAARMALAGAGLLDVAGAGITDAGTADAVDAVLVALPVILEALSHYRDEITAWIDRRLNPTIPAEEIERTVRVLSGEDAQAPARLPPVQEIRV